MLPNDHNAGDPADAEDGDPQGDHRHNPDDPCFPARTEPRPVVMLYKGRRIVTPAVWEARP